MSFWNSMFSKSQAVFSAIKKESTVNIFVKNILPYKMLESNLRVVKDKIGKPLSLSETIFCSHLEDPVKQDIERGVSFLKLRPDRVKMQDASAKMAMLQTMSSGSKRIAVPTTIKCDHLIVTQTGGVKDLKRANQEEFSSLKTASAKYNVDAMANLPRELKCPKIIGVNLTRKMKSLTTLKNAVILKAGNILTVKGGTELFQVASLYSGSLCTTQSQPKVFRENNSIIVPGFPKPNGLPQKNPYDGSERDLINFPRMVRLEEPPKTRYLFVPEEWFEIFYKKTGVTGPYVLAAGITTFLLSKEIWVVDHEFPYVLATIGVFYVGWNKFGASIARTLDREIDEYEESCNAFRKNEIQGLTELIENQKKEVWRTEAQEHIIHAKRENMAFQYEAVRRQRLIQVYNQVKLRLDYQVELANLTRTIQHRHMVKWIIKNVLISLTAEKEKMIFEQCLKDIQALAEK